jgi:hypothetical protein
VGVAEGGDGVAPPHAVGSRTHPLVGARNVVDQLARPEQPAEDLVHRGQLGQLAGTQRRQRLIGEGSSKRRPIAIASRSNASRACASGSSKALMTSTQPCSGPSSPACWRMVRARASHPSPAGRSHCRQHAAPPSRLRSGASSPVDHGMIERPADQPGRRSADLSCPVQGAPAAGGSPSSAGKRWPADYQPWPGSKARPGSGASSRRTVASMRP